MTKRISFILLILLLFIPLIEVASAAVFENYTTKIVSIQEKSKFLDRLDLSVVNTESKANPISHFAISKEGQIALGFNSAKNAEINVYNSCGQFLYGFRILNNGSAFAIFFEDEFLSIFWGKSNYVGSFDSEGNCLQFRKVINTNQTADAYDNDRYRPSSDTIGNIRYYAEGNWLTHKYSRFIIEDNEGNKTVLYDATEEIRTRNIARITFFGSIGLFIAFAVYKEKKEECCNQPDI